MIIFTTALIITAIVISHLIKRQEPWTQSQDIWLSLMGIGLVVALLSLTIKALWIRRNWKCVRASCLDQENWEGLTEGPDPDKKLYLKYLCEFELDGRTYQATPSYWRTFATKVGVPNFLKRKVSPSGWCQLRINPDNPLQAEIGPDHDAEAGFFNANRWLQLVCLACLILVVGAVFHYYDQNDPRRETIPNPVVALSAAEATEFEPGWKNGYPFTPFAKKA